MVCIKKVNIYDSPILAVTKNSTTVYLVLDYGATSSLITMRKATELGLRINHTYHTAVQVDPPYGSWVKYIQHSTEEICHSHSPHSL